MKRIKSVLSVFVVTAILFFNGCASAPQNMANKNSREGSEITIASTSVAICEILDRLGYNNVIGVPETSGTLPERYLNAASLGSPMNPDLEIIKSLSPDLILSPQTLEASLSESYKSIGVSSAFLDLSSVEGMYSSITSLGEYLGCEEAAEELNNEYAGFMKSYSVGVDEEPDILLLMTFPDGFYLVATENSYVGNLVKLAGGNNVYGSDYEGDENGFVSINPEDIVQKEPDMILVFAHYSEKSAFEYMKKEFKENNTWQYFDAMKEDKIAYLPSEYFGMSASLDWTESLEYLRPILHGEQQ